MSLILCVVTRRQKLQVEMPRGSDSAFLLPCIPGFLSECAPKGLYLRLESLSWFAHCLAAALGRSCLWPRWVRAHCSSGGRLLWDALWLTKSRCSPRLQIFYQPGLTPNTPLFLYDPHPSTLATLICHSNNIHAHHCFPFLAGLNFAFLNFIFKGFIYLGGQREGGGERESLKQIPH